LRDAEDAHHRVPGDVHHPAPQRFELVPHHPVVGGQEFPIPLRIDERGQARRAHQVDEDDRDDLALLGGGGDRREPAARAEASPLGKRLAAPFASQVVHRARIRGVGDALVPASRRRPVDASRSLLAGGRHQALSRKLQSGGGTDPIGYLSARRRSSFRSSSAMLVPTKIRPSPKIIVPRTNTCGGMPTFTAPQIHSGKVLVVPATKLEVTKSSIDRANASSPPASMPGKISGRVTFQKVTHGVAPRSCAASSNPAMSKPASRARTVIVTYAMLNMTCAMNRVRNPLGMASVMKKPSRDAPSTISGVAMTSVRTCSIPRLPRNRYRTRATANSVPIAVATTLVRRASRSDRKKAGVRPGT